MKNTNIENHLESFVIGLHNKIAHVLREKALKLDFTFSQMEVLRYVGCQKNPTMKEIANYLRITPPSVTAIIESLMKKGLIKREADKADHRVVRIMTTTKASRIFDSFKDKKLEIIKDIISKLNKKDKDEFMRILTILN